MSNNEEKDGSAMLHSTEKNNPLQQRLSPKQFQASVKFYEADHQLKNEDRENIASDLQSVIFKTSIISYGSAMGNFALPTIIHNFQTSQKFFRPAGGRLRAIPTIHKPFFSFLLGLTALLVTSQQATKYQFSKKIDSLQTQNTDSNQLRVWQAMDPKQAGLFYIYYRRTLMDPSFILKDPRTFTEKSLHEVHYHPSQLKNQSQDQHFTKVLGFENYEPSLSSKWNEIRKENGFVNEINSAPSEDALDSSNNTAVENSAERPQTPSKTSAWDKVRQSSGK